MKYVIILNIILDVFILAIFFQTQPSTVATQVEINTKSIKHLEARLDSLPIKNTRQVILIDKATREDVIDLMLALSEEDRD